MDWAQTGESLLREIEPDFRRPIYLLEHSEAAAFHPELGVPDVAAAFTRNQLARSLKSFLGDRWHGDGFAAVVNLENADGGFPGLMGIVLHEAAHELVFRHQRRNKPKGEFDEWMADPERARDLRRVVEAWDKKHATTYPRWDMHEADFVRAAAHLAHRAGNVMQCIRPKHLTFAEPYYGVMFNEAAFMDALRDELTSSDSICDILATEPPQAFSERWQDATSWWDNR